MDCLVVHPSIGSVWMTNCQIKDGVVQGDVWDRTMAGSPYYPDDYSGEYVTMWFKESCIRKTI